MHYAAEIGTNFLRDNPTDLLALYDTFIMVVATVVPRSCHQS